MRRVLVVDDEPAICHLVAEALTDLGMEVVQANGGEEALERLCEATAQGRPYDAVVLDIVMPHVDGWQVLHAIKNNPLWKKMRVVVLTAQATSVSDVAKVVGYDGVFVEKKGIYPRMVQRIVSRLLPAGQLR